MNGRPRKNTLETFNAEMAVLDRPLEGDVEYYDEKPPSWFRGKAPILIGIVAIGAITGLASVKLRSSTATAAPAKAQPATPAPAVAAPSAAVAAAAPSPAGAVAAPSPAAVPPEATPVAVPADDPMPDEAAPARQRPAPRAAWAKIRKAGGHPKQARTTTKTTTYHRTTVKRTVVVKHTVAGRR